MSIDARNRSPWPISCAVHLDTRISDPATCTVPLRILPIFFLGHEWNMNWEHECYPLVNYNITIEHGHLVR